MQRIDELFEECIQECEQIGIPIGSFERSVVINARARKRWGACKQVGKTGVLTRKQPIFRIEISKQLAENGSDFDIKNTLVHELIHTCKGCLNHGKLWHYHASKMNSVYGYRVKSTASGDEMESEKLHDEYRKAQCKYQVKCQGCGLLIYRMKKSKLIEHPEYYRCSKCGGNLEVVKAS